MDEYGLQSRILSVRAEGFPARALVFGCEIETPTSPGTYILDAWMEVRLHNGGTVAVGKMLRCRHRFGRNAAPQSRTGADIVVPLTDRVLQMIEQQRAGGDVEFWINGSMLVAHAHEAGDAKVLGAPFEMRMDDGHRGRVEYKVPHSEWIKLLQSLSWSELELLEIPRAAIHNDPKLTRAFGRFREAQDCFRRGDWDGTLGDCRKAIEAMIKEITGKDSASGGLDAIQTLVSAEAKAKAINATIMAFNGFLHLGRHEQQPYLPIKPVDASLALHLVGSLLAYLGSQ